MMNSQQLVTIVSILGPIGAGSIYIQAKIARPWQSFKDMLEDWHGDEPRPGVPARQGVMLRLAQLEENTRHNTDTIEELRKRDDAISNDVSRIAQSVQQIHSDILE